MLPLVILLVFLLVAAAVFAFGWLVDDRRAHGRVMRERRTSPRIRGFQKTSPACLIEQPDVLDGGNIAHKSEACGGGQNKIESVLPPAR